MYSALNSEFDVIVSGGGLTGVVCAVRLARSGRRVVLVERRGSLGWEIGRARRVFLDLTRWRSLSPTLQELEERFRRVHAMADGVLSAPVVELALDAWILRWSPAPLLYTGSPASHCRRRNHGRNGRDEIGLHAAHRTFGRRNRSVGPPRTRRSLRSWPATEQRATAGPRIRGPPISRSLVHPNRCSPPKPLSTPAPSRSAWPPGSVHLPSPFVRHFPDKCSSTCIPPGRLTPTGSTPWPR